MKKILFCILIVVPFSLAQAQDMFFADENKRYGTSSGIRLMNYVDYESEEDGTFYSAAIPFGEHLIPIISNDLLLSLNSSMNWGLSEFFFDYTIGLGLRYYPFGNDFISVYGGGDAGTFFFNNVSTTGRVGSDIDFNVNEDFSVFMGGEVFYRESYRLAEFIESDHWYITSQGWAVNGGFRFRFNLLSEGFQNMPRSL